MGKYCIGVILIVVLAICFQKYLKDIAQDILDNSSYFKNVEVKCEDKVMDADELLLYNGKPGSKGLYLAILGDVFDVQRGKKHYGPGGTYHIFAGRDASKAFITGEFESISDDDVLSLSDQELMSLKSWRDFYKKDYKYIGKVIGRFYDNNGLETDYNRQVKSRIEAAELHKLDQEKSKTIYPPCNSEWSAETGLKLWCTDKSGGVSRDWIGVPRKMFEPGSKSHSCVCVKDSSDLPGTFEEYENCDKTSNTCLMKGN